MKNKQKIKAALIACSMLLVFASGLAQAGSEAIEVTWIVPGDTTISLTVAGDSETEIVFDTGDQTFHDIPMRSQTTSTAGIVVNNDGNKALSIAFVFTDQAPSTMTYFNISHAGNNNDTRHYWTSDNETISQVLNSNLAYEGSDSFWIYSSGTSMEESTEGTDKVTVTFTGT